MLICNNCGSTFDFPKTMVDVVIDGEGYNYSVCPFCGDDDLSETESCKGCGKDIKKYRDYCDNCRDNIFKELHKLWDFYEKEKAFLEIVGDWIDAQ